MSWIPLQGDTKPVWLVKRPSLTWNSRHIRHVCEIEGTARRLAEKAFRRGHENDLVEQAEAVWHNGRWLVPADIVQPNADDILYQRNLDRVESVRAKAKSLGLSSDEIRILSMPVREEDVLVGKKP